jgi:hypothetical protein
MIEDIIRAAGRAVVLSGANSGMRTSTSPRESAVRNQLVGLDNARILPVRRARSVEACANKFPS